MPRRLIWKRSRKPWNAAFVCLCAILRGKNRNLLSCGPAHFPAIPLVNGHIETGDEIEIITVTYDTPDCHRNIVFTGCRFKGPKAKIDVRCCRGLAMDGNTFDIPLDKAVNLVHVDDVR